MNEHTLPIVAFLHEIDTNSVIPTQNEYNQLLNITQMTFHDLFISFFAQYNDVDYITTIIDHYNVLSYNIIQYNVIIKFSNTTERLPSIDQLIVVTSQAFTTNGFAEENYLHLLQQSLTNNIFSTTKSVLYIDNEQTLASLQDQASTSNTNDTSSRSSSMKVIVPIASMAAVFIIITAVCIGKQNHNRKEKMNSNYYEDNNIDDITMCNKTYDVESVESTHISDYHTSVFTEDGVDRKQNIHSNSYIVTGKNVDDLQEVSLDGTTIKSNGSQEDDTEDSRSQITDINDSSYGTIFSRNIQRDACNEEIGNDDDGQLHGVKPKPQWSISRSNAGYYAPTTIDEEEDDIEASSDVTSEESSNNTSSSEDDEDSAIPMLRTSQVPASVIFKSQHESDHIPLAHQRSFSIDDDEQQNEVEQSVKKEDDNGKDNDHISDGKLDWMRMRLRPVIEIKPKVDIVATLAKKFDKPPEDNKKVIRSINRFVPHNKKSIQSEPVWSSKSLRPTGMLLTIEKNIPNDVVPKKEAIQSMPVLSTENDSSQKLESSSTSVVYEESGDVHVEEGVLQQSQSNVATLSKSWNQHSYTKNSTMIIQKSIERHPIQKTNNEQQGSKPTSAEWIKNVDMKPAALQQADSDRAIDAPINSVIIKTNLLEQHLIVNSVSPTTMIETKEITNNVHVMNMEETVTIEPKDIKEDSDTLDISGRQHDQIVNKVVETSIGKNSSEAKSTVSDIAKMFSSKVLATESMAQSEGVKHNAVVFKPWNKHRMVVDDSKQPSPTNTGLSEKKKNVLTTKTGYVDNQAGKEKTTQQNLFKQNLQDSMIVVNNRKLEDSSSELSSNNVELNEPSPTRISVASLASSFQSASTPPLKFHGRIASDPNIIRLYNERKAADENQSIQKVETKNKVLVEQFAFDKHVKSSNYMKIQDLNHRQNDEENQKQMEGSNRKTVESESDELKCGQSDATLKLLPSKLDQGTTSSEEKGSTVFHSIVLKTTILLSATNAPGDFLKQEWQNETVVSPPQSDTSKKETSVQPLVSNAAEMHVKTQNSGISSLHRVEPASEIIPAVEVTARSDLNKSRIFDTGSNEIVLMVAPEQLIKVNAVGDNNTAASSGSQNYGKSVPSEKDAPIQPPQRLLQTQNSGISSLEKVQTDVQQPTMETILTTDETTKPILNKSRITKTSSNEIVLMVAPEQLIQANDIGEHNIVVISENQNEICSAESQNAKSDIPLNTRLQEEGINTENEESSKGANGDTFNTTTLPILSISDQLSSAVERKPEVYSGIGIKSVVGRETKTSDANKVEAPRESRPSPLPLNIESADFSDRKEQTECKSTVEQATPHTMPAYSAIEQISSVQEIVAFHSSAPIDVSSDRGNNEDCSNDAMKMETQHQMQEQPSMTAPTLSMTVAPSWMKKLPTTISSQIPKKVIETPKDETPAWLKKSPTVLSSASSGTQSTDILSKSQHKTEKSDNAVPEWMKKFKQSGLEKRT